MGFTDSERIERRYRNATLVLDSWRAAQNAAVDAEYAMRLDAILSDRQREFQAHGLDQSGRQV